LKELRSKVERVFKKLKKLYPTPHRPNRTPLEQAIFTVLSQNTTDANAEKCLKNLKEATNGKLSEALKLPEEKLIEAIRPCGLMKQKSRAIKELLSRWPELEKQLKELSPERGIKLLTSIPFIGPKTARVILTFGFNKNAFPIDTHCRRVIKRLGLLPEGWSLERFSRFMEENFSAQFNREFHYNLIRFGRQVCRAVKPKCQECPLKEECREGPINGPAQP